MSVHNEIANKLQGRIQLEGPATRAIAGATAHGEKNAPAAQSQKVLQLETTVGLVSRSQTTFLLLYWLRETTVGWDIGKPSISELLTIVKQFK